MKTITQQAILYSISDFVYNEDTTMELFLSWLDDLFYSDYSDEVSFQVINETLSRGGYAVIQVSEPMQVLELATSFISIKSNQKEYRQVIEKTKMALSQKEKEKMNVLDINDLLDVFSAEGVCKQFQEHRDLEKFIAAQEARKDTAEAMKEIILISSAGFLNKTEMKELFEMSEVLDVFSFFQYVLNNEKLVPYLEAGITEGDFMKGEETILERSIEEVQEMQEANLQHILEDIWNVALASADKIVREREEAESDKATDESTDKATDKEVTEMLTEVVKYFKSTYKGKAFVSEGGKLLLCCWGNPYDYSAFNDGILADAKEIEKGYLDSRHTALILDASKYSKEDLTRFKKANGAKLFKYNC